MNLEHYQTLWNLERTEFQVETACGKIYRAWRDNELFALKIYTDIGAEDEKAGAELLRLCNGQGAVNIIESDPRALLMEYCEGDDLEQLVLDGRDDEATEIIAQTLQQIHSVPVPENHDLVTLEERFESLFKIAKSQNNPIFSKASELAKSLLNNQKDVCLLHGDMHHNNILYHQKRGWLAIDPKGLVGERTYDVVNTLKDPQDHPEIFNNIERFQRHVKIFSDAMNMDYQRIIDYAFCHCCLSVSWSIKDFENSKSFPKKYVLELAEKIMPLATKI